MRRRMMVTAAMTVMLAVTCGVGVARGDASIVPDTKYTGHYYTLHPAENLRKCIVYRESRNVPSATSRGNHQGLYQMTPELGEGAAWMMRMDPFDPITKRQRLWLQETPVKQWPRYWQDRAFYTVLNVLGAEAGAKHWHLTGSTCNRFLR